MITERECIECGLCCFLGKVENFTGPLPSIVREDGYCIHRKENGCDIYENRWDACKLLERGGEACLQIRFRKNSNL